MKIKNFQSPNKLGQMKKSILIIAFLVLCTSVFAAKVVVDSGFLTIDNKLWVKNGATGGSPSSTLALDADGPIGATQYCDSNGQNCVNSLGSSSPLPSDCNTGDILVKSPIGWDCRPGVIPIHDCGDYDILYKTPSGWDCMAGIVEESVPLGRIVTFDWSASYPQATFPWYQLFVYRNGQTYYNKWVQGSKSHTPNVSFGFGQYTWKVRSWSSSEGYGIWISPSETPSNPFIFSKQLIGTVQLLSPSGSVITTNKPEFKWNQATGATSYQIWINKDGLKYLSTWVSGATTYVPPSDLPYSNDYKWWVRAGNADGNSDWFGPMEFFTGRPNLTSPTGTITNKRPQFTWRSVAGSTWYQIWINKGGEQYLQTWIQGNTYYVPPSDLPVGNYQWWVQSWSASLGKIWSDALSFKVV